MFFLFFFLFLVFCELFTIENTTILILYILYLLFYLFFSNKTNIVSSINFRFVFKNFFFKSSGVFLFLKSRFFSYSRIFKRNNQLKWKPLFKKSSYFGLYRSTKNQYLNK